MIFASSSAASSATGLAVIFALGLGAQWLAWRLKLPAILLLLVTGIIAGPALGLVRPDEIFGDLLHPLVSIAVGIILFEGGLSLQVPEIRNLRRLLVKLVTIGVVVSWLATAVLARWSLDLAWGPALLLGSLFVVTGPTVIGPLLRHIRPVGPAARLLKWEGIVIDPVGVCLALVVFECTLRGGGDPAIVARNIGMTALVGCGFGVIAGKLLHEALRRYWVPESLQNPMALVVVIGVFTLSNAIQSESGLLTVTIMGALLANQTTVAMRHIVEFKENLRVLLISSVFVLLAARITWNDIESLDFGALLFLVGLILVVRPLSVLLSTVRSDLAWKDRAFLMWMAPRGVVAAVVSSEFALALEPTYPEARVFVPIAFLVIIGTVAIYGLTAGAVARKLGVAGEPPEGLLVLGAHPAARLIAKKVSEAGFRCLLLDVNRDQVNAAKLEGLEAHWGDALSEATLEKLDLEGIGRLIAMTPNASVNRLATRHFAEVFERRDLFRLALGESGKRQVEHAVAQDSRGRLLFDADMTWNYLQGRLASGATIRTTTLSESFDFDELQTKHANTARLLFSVTKSKHLHVQAADAKLAPSPGDTVIYLA